MEPSHLAYPVKVDSIHTSLYVELDRVGLPVGGPVKIGVLVGRVGVKSDKVSTQPCLTVEITQAELAYPIGYLAVCIG